MTEELPPAGAYAAPGSEPSSDGTAAPAYGAPAPAYGAPAYGEPWTSPPAPKRSRTWLVVLATVVVVLVVLGVIGALAGKSKDNSKDTTAAPTTTQAPGGGQVAHGKGISVTVPKGWRAVPLTAKDFKSFIDAFAKTNPTAAGSLQQQMSSMASQHIKFFAVKQSSIGSGFGTNVNILTTPGSGATTDQIIAAAKVELGGLGANGLHSTTVTLPQGKAARLTYTYPIKGASGNVSVQGTQYYVLAGDQVEIATLSSTNRAADEAAFDAMVRSIKLG